MGGWELAVVILTPVALDGRTFASFDVAAGFAVGDQAGPSRNPVLINRADDSPIYGGMRVDGRKLPIAFVVNPGHQATNDTGYVLQNLLAMLRPGESQERTLVVQLADGPNIGTQYEATVSVGQYHYDFRNNLVVDFYAADERWYERTDTLLETVSFSGPVALPLLNHGGATVSPIIGLGYSVQRVTQNPDLGWKWRRTKSIANGGDRNWNRVRLTIDLGDTAAWVTAGKAQASGNDLRVRFEGRELYRTLTNWNSGRTFVHFVGTIPAGKSAMYEIVYGNPEATAPRTLSTRTSHYDTYVADDLQGDSGTATSGTTTTMYDTGATWEFNQWAGGFVGFLSGTGSIRYRRILSNSVTGLTFNRAVTTAPAAGTTYILWKSGIFMDGGRVTAVTAGSITDNLHTDKWAPDSLAGGTVTFIAGSGASPATMTVAGNTTDTITFTTSFSVQPAVNDQFTIQRYGFLNYQVDKSVTGTSHRGLWRSSHYSSAGGEITFGDRTPGGFQPWLMVDNQDQFAQLRVTDETAGASVANWPYLSARRRVRSDLTMPEKGTADGVCLYDPRGIVSFDWNYRVENDNGIGAVSVLVQSPDGDDWNQIVADFTAHTSMTAITSGEATGGYSVVGTNEDPVRIYFGMLPAGGLDSEIESKQSKNRNAEVRNHTRMMIFLSLDDISGLTDGVWVIGAEAEIYDLNVTARLGGGAVGSEMPPYASFAIGGPGHYLHLPTDQRLFINPAPSAEFPLFGLYDTAGLLLQRVPWAGVIKHHENNLDGIDTPTLDYNLALPPGTNMITTGEDNISGWTLSSSGGVVTASISNDTGVVFDGGSTSLKLSVTTTPATPWYIYLARTAGRFTVIPGSLYEFGFVVRRNGLTSAVNARIEVTWSYGGGIVSAADPIQYSYATWTAADTWYPTGSGRSIHAGSVATPATTEAAVRIVINGTGVMSGTVYLDSITMGVPNLYLDEAEIGTLTADISWREAIYA